MNERRAPLLYAAETDSTNLALRRLAAEGAADTRLSGWALVASVAGELAAAGLFALGWVRRIAHLPPLALLQEK